MLDSSGLYSLFEASQAFTCRFRTRPGDGHPLPVGAVVPAILIVAGATASDVF
ncbi:MAG: hypothetical protein ACLQGT_12580 [Terracidiphilus sp.]